MPQRAVVAKKTDRGSEFSTPKETDRANEISAPQGLLLVDKPAGMTSHDVVQHVRRVYGERSIGHLGTLDPFATGLLVLLLGRATRLATFIEAEPKVYEATIKFGEETDTDDATGTVIRTATVPREADVRSAVKSLTGTISQVPPAYSAKSVDGTRAYDAARRGEPLELAAVNVTVHAWELGKLTGDSLSAVITCSGGTYIRALARDLGRLTSSAAHLESLRRIRAGTFDVRDAATLDSLADNPARVRALRVVPDA
ncbi:MAG TPA: tRNA pseudouridine(55) synthase TruB [Gemmatimonadaceae bacterium]